MCMSCGNGAVTVGAVVIGAVIKMSMIMGVITHLSNLFGKL